MAFTYTEDQLKVITLRNRNILVSAAAGSGKTAVLVERIIQMVSDKEHPVDIDRLLIVTFTNAAAAEMRERISLALQRKLEEEPDNVHLQKQVTLIHNAQITTIDSFCLFIIRNNFNDIGLDPGFRIGDEGECKLLKQDVLKEVLGEEFEKEEKEEFLELVECFSVNGREKPLEEKILQLYEFSMSLPWPEAFLEERKKDYLVENKDALEEEVWIKLLYSIVYDAIDENTALTETALEICQQSDGPIAYSDAIASDLELLQGLKKCDSLEELYKNFQGIKHAALSRKKMPDADEQKKEIVKALRNQVKDNLKNVSKKFFGISPMVAVEQMEHSYHVMNTLLEVVLRFKERFDAKKREKNIIDFHDMEHLALQILVKEKEDGSFAATETALDYRKHFHEIMIDEYQDSNTVQEFLLQSISGEEEGRFNRFMVGDVKQSIYKFRLARPEIFLEKFEQYDLEESNQQRIDLHKNFRSREEVIDSVNYIFYQIMGRELGNVEYDGKAALFPGAIYPEYDDNATEIILVELDDKKEEATTGETSKKISYTPKELEARAIAKKIEEMVGVFQVTDKASGELREAEYRDIVILLRTNAGWDEVFKRVLNEFGIPAYIASKTGYFSTLEIKNIMNYLSVIDNPLQDIPLFGVMKSFFGQFSDEEIAWISSRNTGKLYTKLEKYVEQVESQEEKVSEEDEKNKEKEEILQGETEQDFPELLGKIKKFLERLSLYRKKVAYQPIHKLIQELLNETGYLHYISALPAGEQRAANVKMLLEKAIAFENTSYFGLFHFIRYMKEMEKYNIDYGEASTLDEQANHVRIMSIHKSKGLEFPICFVAGMAKRINQMDTNQSLIMDMDLGLGVDYINGKRRIKCKDLRKNIISHKMQMDNLGEELRIFYVALTRAKEKLILTGTVENLENKIINSLYLLDWKERKLPLGIRNSIKSYMDLLLPALVRHDGFQSLRHDRGIFMPHATSTEGDQPNMEIKIIAENSLFMDRVSRGSTREGRKIALELDLKKGQEGTTLYKNLEEQFAFSYGKEELKNLCTKTTVTELKKAVMLEETEVVGELFVESEIVPYIPQFMKEKEEGGGVRRGNIYHKVLELLTFAEEPTVSSYQEQIAFLMRQGRIEREDVELLSQKKMMNFLSSPVAKRMRKAETQKLLYREQPFVLGISADRLNPSISAEEIVLMQGIIDAYFIEDGEIVIVDYKTDRVKTEQELLDRYSVQLDYYKEALVKLTGMKVKEMMIYSFALEKEIMIEPIPLHVLTHS